MNDLRKEQRDLRNRGNTYTPTTPTTPRSTHNLIEGAGTYNAPKPQTQPSVAPSSTGSSYAPSWGGFVEGATAKHGEAVRRVDSTVPEASYNTTGGGYPTPQTQNTAQVTSPPQEIQAQSITTIDSSMTGIQDLGREIMNMQRELGDRAMAEYAAHTEKLVASLDEYIAQYRAHIESQMTGDDPAMQEALRVIRDEAERMRRDTLEELNARGLVQSGVYARALTEMNNSELTQSQSAISARFGDLQNQLNNALLSLAQTRFSIMAGSNETLAGMNMQNQSNILEAGLGNLNANVTLRGQDLGQDQFEKSLAQNKYQFDKTYDQTNSHFNQNLASSQASSDWRDSQSFYQWETERADAKAQAEKETLWAEQAMLEQSGVLVNFVNQNKNKKFTNPADLSNALKAFGNQLQQMGYSKTTADAAIAQLQNDPSLTKHFTAGGGYTPGANSEGASWLTKWTNRIYPI